MTTATREQQDAVAQAVAILSAIEAAPVAADRAVPTVHWLHGDDGCDCTFQRIGEWTNPYLAETLRVRLCCIWRKIYEQYPQFVQDIPAYYDQNRHAWVTEPREWDSEDADMPTYLWYRQRARLEGKPLAQIRNEYAGRVHERPKAVPHEVHMARRDEPTAREVEMARLGRLRITGWVVDE